MAASRDFTREYYSGEKPMVGDIVALGGNPTAQEWVVTRIEEAVRAGYLIDLERQKTRRHRVYASQYRLVRRAAGENAHG